MTYLPVIGFGILVISLRLIMIWRGSRRPRRPRRLRNVPVEGLIVVAIGLIAWLLGTFVSGDIVLRNTGYAIMIIGIISIVQWVVQTRRGTLDQVRFWGLTTAVIGGSLIIVYAIWWLYGWTLISLS